MLTRWCIVDDRKILLPHQHPVSGQRRIAVEATLASGDVRLVAYSVHTETIWLHGRGRLDQARAIARLAGARPSIVAGDLNTSDRGSLLATIDLFRAAGFTWASKTAGPTLVAGPIELTLDHVFARGLNPRRAGSLSSSSASDHLPVWVELETYGLRSARRRQGPRDRRGLKWRRPSLRRRRGEHRRSPRNLPRCEPAKSSSKGARPAARQR